MSLPAALAVALYPSASDIFTILGNVASELLPPGVEVAQGQVNRVPEPKPVDFVEMWPFMTPRLGTNADTPIDCVFTAAIAGDVMSVSAVNPNPLFSGKLMIGSPVFGVNVEAGTVITGQTGGTPGGVGTYTVAPTQTVGSEKMAAGVAYLTQPVEAVVQLDFHGPNAWDNSATFATVFRDEKGVALFAKQWKALFDNEVNGLTPLYCDDPKQVPFTNDQDQYETRFVVHAHMQVNQSLGLPQQFADQLDATLIAVP